MAGRITVEEVVRRTERRRFADLPHVLHGDDPRWAPPVRSFDRWRADTRRHPYFVDVEHVLLLARDLGRPAGRIAVHLDRRSPGEGRFGFLAVPDDADVLRALLDAARAWLAERSATTLSGPYSWTPADEFGVVTSGHAVAGTTGRPWTPAHYADLLVGEGFGEYRTRPTWRLSTMPGGAVEPGDADLPVHAGGYADPRIVLGGIAAVPDVSATLRATSVRSAWATARRARERAWETAVVVGPVVDPPESVPRLQAAAGAAGYHRVIAPWHPDPDAPPEVVHTTFRREL